MTLSFRIELPPDAHIDVEKGVISWKIGGQTVRYHYAQEGLSLEEALRRPLYLEAVQQKEQQRVVFRVTSRASGAVVNLSEVNPHTIWRLFGDIEGVRSDPYYRDWYRVEGAFMAMSPPREKGRDF